MTTAPVATRYTFEFVRQKLSELAQTVLEIGCGSGELAAALIEAGLNVLALDSDPDCVEAARAAGVDARVAQWPTQLETTFDAVLFTRSLHHIAPLDDAIAAAVDALRPNGAIIVEDFRIELTSPRTDAWFAGLARLFDAGQLFREGFDIAALLDKLDFGEHRHELHSSPTIEQALSRHGPVRREDAAYYFRYAEAELSDGIAPLLLDYELSLIESGAIDALGARFVLTPRA
jgi:SAM-dependent methyltransferase